MQQAYRALRIVAEAQTLRIVLAPAPSTLLLDELGAACATLRNENSQGLKAIVLDFPSSREDGLPPPPAPRGSPPPREASSPPSSPRAPSPPLPAQDEMSLHNAADRAAVSVQAIEQPVIAVVRASLSVAAARLVWAADLILAADEARLPLAGTGAGQDSETLSGEQAAHMGYITWSASAASLETRLNEILEMLRSHSASALRNVKAAVHISRRMQTPLPSLFTAETANTTLRQQERAARLEALKRVNTFYLEEVMKTKDAHEGLQAFLQKREPKWENR